VRITKTNAIETDRLALPTITTALSRSRLVLAARSRPHLQREAIYVAIGQAGYAVGTVILLKVLTSLLIPSEYGRLAIGLVIVGTLNQLVYLPISSGLLRYFRVFKDKDELDALGRTHDHLHGRAAAGLLTIGSVAVAIFYVCGLRWLALLIAVAVLLSISDGLNATTTAIMTAARHRRATAVAEGLQPWARAGGASAALLLFVPSGQVALGGYCVANLVTAALQRLYLHRSGLAPWCWRPTQSSSFERTTRATLGGYIRAFTVWGGAIGLSTFWDRWTLQAFLGTPAVGAYTAIFQIASAPPVILSRVLTRFGIPLVFDAAGAGEDRHRLGIAMQMVYVLACCSCLVFVPILTISIFSSHQIVSLFTSRTYAQHARLLPILLTASFATETAMVLRTQGLAANRPSSYTRPVLIQAILGGALGIIGASMYGLEGVATGLLVANVAFLGLVLRVNRMSTH
jgi:O-antigen/teichoic acid export membrane protein